MQTNDLPRIGVLSADPAAVTQFLRRVQALGADPTALLPLSPAAVPDCEPYLCGTSTQSPLPKLRAAAEVLAASGCTVIAAPETYRYFERIRERIVKFVAAHSHISEDRFRQLMLSSGDMANDVGSVLYGEEAVTMGIIDRVGSLSDALDSLYRQMDRRREE